MFKLQIMKLVKIFLFSLFFFVFGSFLADKYVYPEESRYELLEERQELLNEMKRLEEQLAAVEENVSLGEETIREDSNDQRKAEGYSKQIKTLKTTLKNRDSQIRSLRQQQRILKNKLNKLAKQVASLSSQKQNLETKFNQLNQKNSSLQKELAASGQERKSLAAAKQALENDLEKLKQKVNFLTKENQKLKDKAAKAGERIIFLEGELAQEAGKRYHNESLKREVVQLEKKLAAADSELVKQRKHIVELSDKILLNYQELKKRFSKLIGDLEKTLTK
jgi:chromosome segregation ATPase